jgi:hypothetical protein
MKYETKALLFGLMVAPMGGSFLFLLLAETNFVGILTGEVGGSGSADAWIALLILGVVMGLPALIGLGVAGYQFTMVGVWFTRRRRFLSVFGMSAPVSIHDHSQRKLVSATVLKKIQDHSGTYLRRMIQLRTYYALVAKGEFVTMALPETSEKADQKLREMRYRFGFIEADLKKMIRLAERFRTDGLTGNGWQSYCHPEEVKKLNLLA